MKSVLVSIAMMFSFSMSASATSLMGFPFYKLAEAQIHPFHSLGAKAVEGSVQFDRQMITLEVKTEMDCPADQPCIAVMPNPILVTLPVVNVQESYCGDIYEATLLDEANVVHTLKVVDYSNAICDMIIQNVVHVTYTTEYVNSLYQSIATSYLQFTNP